MKTNLVEKLREMRRNKSDKAIISHATPAMLKDYQKTKNYTRVEEEDEG